MTKHKAREIAKLATAFADGKQLQYNNLAGCWIDEPNPDFNDPLLLRIKPEPKLIPFTRDNCPVGKVVKAKANGIRRLITGAHDSKSKGVEVGGTWMGNDELLANWTMDDGSPCGTEVSE